MKYMALIIFLVIFLTIGLVGTLGGDKANPSPEQWIAAAQDIGDKKIADMTSHELEVTSTAIQVESFQELNRKVGWGMWALGAIAAGVVTRVVFVDLLGWGRRPN